MSRPGLTALMKVSFQSFKAQFIARDLPLARENMLRILAINDVYTLENLPRLSTLMRMKTLESKQGVTLRTLAGDFLSPNLLSPIDSGLSFMRCFNAIGVSHFCFGNHEANLKKAQLRERLLECRGALLNSNVPSLNQMLQINLPAFDVIEIGEGIRVGVLGLLSSDPRIFVDRKFKGCPINAVVESAKHWTRTLKNEHGVQHFIALSHQSIDHDRELAGAIEGLHVIIGGHEHNAFDEKVNGCRIFKSGKDAEACGIVDLSFNDKKDQIPCINYKLESVQNFEEDSKIREIVDAAMQSVKQLENEIMIPLECRITASGSRFRPTDLGTMICSILRDELETELAIMNGASIKSSSDCEGGISLAELHKILPFPTKMIAVDMPGDVIQEAVKASRRPWDKEKKGFLQLDDRVEVLNPSFTGAFGGPEPAEEKTDRIISVNREAFDKSRMYRVAVPRNLLNGFCEILPLMQFNEANQDKMPEEDAFIQARDLVISNCAKRIWSQLGEFTEIDQNRDGRVSPEELKVHLRKLFSRTPSSLFVDGLIDALDLNHDGFISEEEFASLKQKI